MQKVLIGFLALLFTWPVYAKGLHCVGAVNEGMGPPLEISLVPDLVGKYDVFFRFTMDVELEKVITELDCTFASEDPKIISCERPSLRGENSFKTERRTQVREWLSGGNLQRDDTEVRLGIDYRSDKPNHNGMIGLSTSLNYGACQVLE